MKNTPTLKRPTHFYAQGILRFIIVSLCLITAGQLCAQCRILGNTDYIHGNQIRTVTSTAGDMFWDRYDAQFLAPYSGEASPSSIFAAALWIGGYDQEEKLYLSAQTYVNNTRFEFAPGPLINGEVSGEICANWNRHWNVYRQQILSHLADFEDNGLIDDPIKAIYGWPGKNNPHFESVNGFPLPNDSLLSAPFIDIDGNGNYTPDGGDFPHPENIDPSIIPSEMQWCVFNDLAPDPLTPGDGTALEFEFQLTTYAFSCGDNDILDHTIFTSYRIINRSENTYDSLRMGLWMDPDLGCYTDDYIGSAPALNSFFSFNEDSIDGNIGTICSGVSFLPTYGIHPPVQSTTFLNADLSSFTYYANALNDVPPGMTDPRQDWEFYNLLNSSFTDGTPITVGGNGYQSSSETTKHAFPGNPLDTEAWSMQNSDLNDADRRVVAGTDLGTLAPHQFVTIDVAHTFHLDTALTREGNIARMYPRLDTLLVMYKDQLFETCAFPTEPCDKDCVWPGDANHDGIVDNIDFLTVLANTEAAGSKRVGPLAWQPLPAEDWGSATFYGTNNKHCDTNGDGIISEADLAVVELYFGNTDGSSATHNEPRFGSNFTLSAREQIINTNNIWPPIDIHCIFTPQFDDEIQGMTFQLSFDPEYFDANPAIAISYTSIFNDSLKFYREISTDSTVNFVDALFDGDFSRPISGDILSFKALHSRPEVTDGRDTTYIEIRNAKALLRSGEIISIPGERLPIIFVDSAPPIQLPTSSHTGEIRVYPNPTEGAFIIEVADKYMGSDYSIVDIQGRLIQGGTVNHYRNQLELPSGVFIIRVNTMDGSITERIVVVDY